MDRNSVDSRAAEMDARRAETMVDGTVDSRAAQRDASMVVWMAG